MYLYSHMFFTGLLLGLVLDGVTNLGLVNMKYHSRISIIFIIAIILFIISLLIGNTIGNSIGFISLGIYLTALSLALAGIQSSWRKYVYITVIIAIATFYFIYFI